MNTTAAIVVVLSIFPAKERSNDLVVEFKDADWAILFDEFFVVKSKSLLDCVLEHRFVLHVELCQVLA